MELYREVRAFYIKLPYSYKEVSHDIVDALWSISRDFAVSAIDINKNNEVLIHSEIEFTLENWNDAIRYMRSVNSLLNTKSGYLAVRKVIALASGVRTEIEGYKVTKRGVYNTELPECPDFIEDIIRLSGRNKRRQQIDAMEKLFRFIEEQEKDDDGKA